MKITDVDIIPIYPKIAARNADQKTRFINLNRRTIFKINDGQRHRRVRRCAL